jgi:LysM repeat protein
MVVVTAIVGLMMPLQACCQRDAVFNAYIEKYKSAVVAEMQRTQIPASIKMAQAILESNAGRSTLATNANNHFGIKCGNQWTGGTFYLQDDDKDSEGKPIPSCFRKYSKPVESFVDHSEFIRDPKKVQRYGPLFDLPITDYKGWANGLQKGGYATNPQYASILIRLIETYELFKLDAEGAALAGSHKPGRPGRAARAAGTSNLNNRRVVITASNNTLIDVAKTHGVSITNLRKYNEKLDVPADMPLPAKTYIFLQPKRNAWRGKNKYHYVTEGQSMYRISQMYGIKLDKLYKRNHLPEGVQVIPGGRLKLRGCPPKSDSPPFRASTGFEDRITPASTSVQGGNTPGTPTQPTRPNPGTGANKPGPVKITEDGYLDIDITPGGGTTPAPQTGGVTPPPPSGPVTAPSTPNNTPAGTQPMFHTVAAGETLFAISRRYNTTVEAIQRLNNMTGTALSIGQQIRVR